MGRTKRRRKKIREKEKHDWSEIIQLQKSMKLKCKHLKIGYFSGTGRGIKCTKKITKGGILIALPLCHLITTDSPSNIFSFLKSKLSNPQLVLSVLLIYENHLQRESKYVEYLRTLPKSYTNLYFCTMEEIQLLPDFIQNLVLRQRDNLQHLYKKLSDSINNAICPHCNVPISNFYTEDKFLWAWFTVHTRSVYYEDELKNNKSLALAPFLDMFNHSNEAHTKMYIDFKNKLYILKTLVTYPKFKEVFIKYGSHSSTTLLLDYGFLTQNNPHDFIEFTFDEVLETTRELNYVVGETTKLKYNFICGNKLNQNLSKSKDEFSWNLNALIYVLITQDQNISVLQSKAYSNEFSIAEELSVKKIKKALMRKKLNQLRKVLIKMETIEKCTESFQLAKELIKIHMNLLR